MTYDEAAARAEAERRSPSEDLDSLADRDAFIRGARWQAEQEPSAAEVEAAARAIAVSQGWITGAAPEFPSADVGWRARSAARAALLAAREARS